MDCDTVINLDNVTLQDCVDLCDLKNTYVEINDGHIVNLVKGGD
jgi:hypothetical protein